jgi:CRP/FNR family cyclic AMP-dependent transcriptional regulator
MSHTINIEKGKVLLNQGEASTNMYILKEGQLRVTLNKGGRLIELGFIYPGEMVGEMSFLDQEPRSATVKAITDCTLIEIPGEKFDELMKDLPKWYITLLKTLLGRLRKANKFRT